MQITVIWQLVRLFAVRKLVMGANPNLIELVEHICFHEVDFRYAIQHDAVAQRRQVDPTATAGTAGGRTEFSAGLPNLLPYPIFKLCREWAAAYAGTIRLADSVYLLYMLRGDAQPGAGPSHDGARRGDVWISAKVNVEHGALGSLSQNVLSLLQQVIEQILGVGELQSAQEFNGREEIRLQLGYVEAAAVEFGQRGMTRYSILVALLEIGQQDVADTQAGTTDLILVGGAYTFKSRADFATTPSFLINSVEGAVRRQDELRLARNVEVGRPINSPIGEFLKLLAKDNWVEDYAIADNIDNVWMKDSGWHLVQYVLDAIESQSMASIGTTLEASYYVVGGGEYIDDFAFALISPLQSY